MKNSFLLVPLISLVMSTTSFARGPLSPFDPANTNPRVAQEMTYSCGILDLGYMQFELKLKLKGALSQVIDASSDKRKAKLLMQEKGSDSTPYEQTLDFIPMGSNGVYAYTSGGTGITLIYILEYTDSGVILKREIQEEGDVHGRVDLENRCRVTKVRNS